MKNSLPIHPILIGLFPVLSLYATNAEEVLLPEVLPSAGAALLIAAVPFAASLALARSPSRAAIVSSMMLLWFWFFTPLAGSLQALTGVLGVGAWIAAFLLWSALMLAATLGVMRRVSLSSATTILNVCSAVLCLTTVPALIASFSGFGGSAPPAESRSTLAAAPAAPESEQLRDVFVIVLDAYGRADQLRRYFGYEDILSAGLAERGFHVPTRATANYPDTAHSLPSFFNYGYQEGLHPMTRARSICRSAFRAQLERRGYRFASCATGFGATECVKSNGYMPVSSSSLLRSFSNFEQTLLNGTPVEYWLRRSGRASPYETHRRRILGCLEAIPRKADNGVPDLVFAHLLSPHGPFVFGRNGEDVSPYEVPYSINYVYDDPEKPAESDGVGPEYARRYRAQAAFIAEKTLEAVDEILDRSETPPVILVLGDHGPRGFPPGGRRALHGSLLAFHSPSVALKDQLYPEISLVNALRVVLNAHFGGDHELLPDRHYRIRMGRFVPVELKE